MRLCISIILAASTVLAVLTSGLEDGGSFCDPDVPSRSLNYKTRLLLSNSTQNCGAGQYFNQSQVECLPCPTGTFMTKLMSEKRFASCLPCLKASGVEVLTEPCTNIRDTTIMCGDAYFRRSHMTMPCESTCLRCEICGAGTYLFQNYEYQTCGGYNDAICCSSRDMKLVEGVCLLRNTPAPLNYEDNGAEFVHVNQLIVLMVCILEVIMI